MKENDKSELLRETLLSTAIFFHNLFLNPMFLWLGMGFIMGIANQRKDTGRIRRIDSRPTLTLYTSPPRSRDIRRLSG